MISLTERQREVLEELCACQPGYGLPITAGVAQQVEALEAMGPGVPVLDPRCASVEWYHGQRRDQTG